MDIAEEEICAASLDMSVREMYYRCL